MKSFVLPYAQLNSGPDISAVISPGKQSSNDIFAQPYWTLKTKACFAYNKYIKLAAPERLLKLFKLTRTQIFCARCLSKQSYSDV